MQWCCCKACLGGGEQGLLAEQSGHWGHGRCLGSAQWSCAHAWKLPPLRHVVSVHGYPAFFFLSALSQVSIATPKQKPKTPFCFGKPRDSSGAWGKRQHGHTLVPEELRCLGSALPRGL